MDLSVMPPKFTNPQVWFHCILKSISSNAPFIDDSPSSSSKLLIYAYTHVLHGFSAMLTSSELQSLESQLGYLSSVPDTLIVPHTTHTTEFLGLNEQSGAWPASGYGKDVIIGVVDSGFWPESQSYLDTGMSDVPSRWRGRCESGLATYVCNKKVIGARYFNQGVLKQRPDLVSKSSMYNVLDTKGHGTHTSSTAAGNYVGNASYFGYAEGMSRGVAPRAKLAIYKALWEQISTESDVLAAIDQAILDRVDILSISLSTSTFKPLFENMITIASFAAIENGIFVAASAGNGGSQYQSLLNEAPWLLTVAASTVDRDFVGAITFGDITVSGSTLYFGDSITSSLSFMHNCMDKRQLEKVRMEIVVCFEDKHSNLRIQVINVESSNAVGAVFITESADVISFLQSTFPAIFLTYESGESIMALISKSQKTLAVATLQFSHLTRLGTKPAPRVAHYSSRGPSNYIPYVLKPDIMAPGTLILASWPSQVHVFSGGWQKKNVRSDFNMMTGTSMATPHAAGVAALVKEVHPEFSPAAIRSAMMTTADFLDNTLQPLEEITSLGSIKVASPLAMGSGQVNPNKAIDPGLIYDIKPTDYVNLLCALNYTAQQIIAVTRLPPSAYDCSNPSLDINYPSFIALDTGDGEGLFVREFRRTVTYVRSEGAVMTFFVEVTQELAGLNITVEPKVLVFGGGNGMTKSYMLTIKATREVKKAKRPLMFGSLTWADVNRKYVVRSPIVVIVNSSRLTSSPFLFLSIFLSLLISY